MAAAEAQSSHKFCAFEFSGCNDAQGDTRHQDGWKLGRSHEVDGLERWIAAASPQKMKLLTDEQAKEPLPKKEIPKPR